MIDSHCHLNLKHFEDDFESMLAHAIADGVRGFMNIGFDPESAAATVDLVERFPFILGVVGCHPHDADRYDEAFERQVRDYLDHERIVGIGEIGLDYYRDLAPREIQQDVFKRLIGMAREKSVPIVIHCRDAFEDVVSILEETGHHRGIFHAFAGTPEEAQRVIDLGFHIGVGGVVTFRNSQLAHTLQSVPLDRIVLETDSPYLTPDPYRGKRNEPSYVVHVARSVAAIKDVSLEEVSRATDENFCSAMGISPAMLPRPVYKVGRSLYIHSDASPEEIGAVVEAARAMPAATAQAPVTDPLPADGEDRNEETSDIVHPEEAGDVETPAGAPDAEPGPVEEYQPAAEAGAAATSTDTAAVAAAPDDGADEDQGWGEDEGEAPEPKAGDDAIDIVEPWTDVEEGPPEELVVCGVGEPLEDVARVLEAAAVARGKGLRVRVNTTGAGNQIAGRDITPDLVGKVDEVVVLFYGATARQHDRVAGRGGEERFEVMKDFVRCAVAAGMDTVCEFVAAPRFKPEPVRELAKSLGARYDIRMYRS
jgi:TatD DNase family protein